LLCGCGKKTRNHNIRVVKVVTENPQYRLFQRKIRVQGSVEASESAVISARTSGNLDLKNVSSGDFVKKGDILFQVDKINLENKVIVERQKLEVAKAELRTAIIDMQLSKTVLGKAQKDVKRAEKLIARNAISDDAYEKVMLNYQEASANLQKAAAVMGHAKAKVEEAKGNLEIAMKELEDSRIKAPFNGVVISTEKDKDEYVNAGNPILTLENPDDLELSMLISAIYYTEICPGSTPAVIYNLDAMKMAESKVTYRSPSIDPLSRTFEVKIKLPKNSGFVSGMLCDVNLILKQHKGYGVPNEAVLLRNNNRYIIYVAKGNKAQAVTVHPGITDGHWTELLQGQKFKEEKVIIEGQAFLNNGDAIKQTDASAIPPKIHQKAEKAH
jgi:multidrug efflux pump subunit AcrA (membrane-fusion protein)